MGARGGRGWASLAAAAVVAHGSAASAATSECAAATSEGGAALAGGANWGSGGCGLLGIPGRSGQDVACAEVGLGPLQLGGLHRGGTDGEVVHEVGHAHTS